MRILLLSTTTGYQLRAFNEAAERLGVQIVFATDRCHTLDDPWQDSAIPVRFHDEEDSLRAIVAAARERPMGAVVAVGDRPVVLAARAADALGLPGNPPGAAAASANKLLARQRFAAAGLNVPWFTVIAPEPRVPSPESRAPSPESRAPSPESRAPFPCVVKPLGLSGSRGVIRADSPQELDRAIGRVRALLARTEVRALRTGLDDQLLVEGFIEGREYAVEGVLTDGVLHVLAVFDKPDPLDGPFFEETIYVTPPALPAGLLRQIGLEVSRAARALGLRHGPVHAECRVCPPDRRTRGSGESDVFVLEVAARPIGGLCSQALRFDPDLSLEELLLRHAVGEDVTRFRREPDASAVMMAPIVRRGLLKRIEGVEDARAVAGVHDVRITAKIDQLVEPLPEGGSYLGFIFARAPRAPEAEAAVREAHGRLTFVIEKEITVR